VSSAWRASRIPALEDPPCRSCAAFYSELRPTVSVCDLIKTSVEPYEGKIVRVRAIFHHDAGQVNLVDDVCPSEGLHAGLANSFQSCEGTRKALTIYSGFGTWYDSSAEVIVVGSVGRLENPTLFEGYGFNILCLEQVKPVGSGRAERIKFAEGELWGLSGR